MQVLNPSLRTLPPQSLIHVATVPQSTCHNQRATTTAYASGGGGPDSLIPENPQ
ncbi:hypothetical protein Droror1_Dr00026474, partial [Drosera rotundifolia]